MQTTDAGIFVDDLKRFERFQKAVELVTDTSCDVKVKAESGKLDNALWTFVSLMRFVVSCNI